ncbi:MAG: hypothetical protein ACYC1C_05160 [Chloroflexota bacterium]
MSAQNRGRVALLRKCAADRDDLIKQWADRKALSSRTASWPVPGAIIDEIIVDVVECRLEFCHLAADTLGETDFSGSRPVIRVNEDHQEIPNYTNASEDGLRVVIQAHELGHVRRDHGKQLGSRLAAELQTTMFDMPKKTITCPRRSDEQDGMLSPAERRREFEAWTYATAFLVCGWPLARCDQYLWLKRCAAEGLNPSPSVLWSAIYDIARQLVVTPTFTARALESLGVFSRTGEVMRLNAAIDPDDVS